MFNYFDNNRYKLAEIASFMNSSLSLIDFLFFKFVEISSFIYLSLEISLSVVGFLVFNSSKVFFLSFP